MATPIIQSVGVTSGAGTPGAGRDDLVSGERVDLSDTNPANLGGTYLWSLTDIPIGSAATMVDPATATPYFTVDVAGLEGSYVVRCVAGGAYASSKILACSLPVTDSRVPASQEGLSDYDGGGNTKGWHTALTKFMRNVDTYLGNSAPIPLVLAAGDITVDFTAAYGRSYSYDLDDGDAALADPIGIAAGMEWKVVVDADASHELTYGAMYTFGTETAPDFSSMVNGDQVRLDCYAVSATRILVKASVVYAA